jgi:hypothetical protein
MPNLPRPRRPDAQGGGWVGHAEARELSTQRGGRPYASKTYRRRLLRRRLTRLAVMLGITIAIVTGALLVVQGLMLLT